MGKLVDAFYSMFEGNGSGELGRAGAQSVERHCMPTVVVLADMDGGRRNGRTVRVTPVNRARCAGGRAKNVMYSGSGSGIVGECGSCGTTVYWESRLKIWTVPTGDSLFR